MLTIFTDFNQKALSEKNVSDKVFLELELFRIIAAFCGTPVAQNAVKHGNVQAL